LSDVNASSLAAGLGFNDESFDEASLPRFYVVMPNLSVVVGVEKGSG
jgi:hypothetical protein